MDKIQGKHFSITDPQGVNTVIYRVNKTPRELLQEYPKFTVQRLEYAEELNGNLKKKTFFVDEPENEEELVILSFGQDRVVINMGLLEEDKVKIAKRPIPIKFDTLYSEQEQEYKEFRYTPDLKRPISIIDPETTEEIKPILYFDEETNEVKGKCKLNCDTNNDGWPDTNIDIDGDGKADLNIDIDNNGLPDLNIDTNGDGVADINIDDDGDGKCDRLCASVSDNKGGMTTIGGGNVNIDTAALIVAFESGADINVSNLYPDDQNDPDVNTTVPDVKFTIINTTSKALHYNLDWINVENTFTSPNFWFKVSSTYNGFNQDWTTAPKSNGRMATEIVVAPKTKQIYTVSFTLHGTGQPQNYDQGKYFRGKVAIDIIED